MDAYRSLSQADQAAPLGAEDLELLATSAFMLGRDDDCLSSLERAHHAYLDAGEAMRAVRCAFWLVINLALRGEMSRATGWLGRAQRLVERDGETASSGAICWYRSCCGMRPPVTGKPRTPPQPTPPRSASVSAMQTCSPSPYMSKAAP